MNTVLRMVIATLACGVAMVAIAEEEGFVPLFDGQTLAGWEGQADTFHVVDGAIVAGSLERNIPQNEFLCSEKRYGDFELRLQAKLVGEGDNAGIQFRSERIPNHHEVIGYQCDMGSAFGGKIWGALYDESRRRKMLAQADVDKVAAVVKADDWNDFVIRCSGPHVEIWLNGLQTVDYVEQEDVAREGIIGLQIHGGKPAQASYRNIRIKELTTSK